MKEDSQPEPTVPSPPAWAREPAARGGTPGRRAVSDEVYGVRLLMLGWCIWLMGVWIVLYFTVGWTGPAFRVMVFAAVIGLMGVWPAVRLSQPGFATGGGWRGAGRAAGGEGEVDPRRWASACGRTLADWLCLNVVWQAVVWPLQYASRWSLEQAAWVAGAVAGWSLLTGLVIAWGRGTDGAWRRVAAMGVCVGIVVAEPLVLGVVRAGGQAGGRAGAAGMRVSPVQALWGLTSPQAAVTTHPWDQQVVAVGLAAVAGWVALGLMLAWACRRGGGA